MHLFSFVVLGLAIMSVLVHWNQWKKKVLTCVLDHISFWFWCFSFDNIIQCFTGLGPAEVSLGWRIFTQLAIKSDDLVWVRQIISNYLSVLIFWGAEKLAPQHLFNYVPFAVVEGNQNYLVKHDALYTPILIWYSTCISHVGSQSISVTSDVCVPFSLKYVSEFN